MTYLEKMIVKRLKDTGYILVNTNVSDVANYIEEVNSQGAYLYTIDNWIKGTKTNYPENIISRYKLLNLSVEYFIQQDGMCLEQTGRLPTMQDYIQATECEEFTDKVGNIPMETIFREFIEEYRNARIV